jgi:hypothetical protein
LIYYIGSFFFCYALFTVTYQSIIVICLNWHLSSLLYIVVIISVTLWYSQISVNFCLNYHSESLIVVVLWKLFIYLKQDTISRTHMHHLIHWV